MVYAARTSARIERLDQRQVDAAMARVAVLARIMDSLYAIPGTNIRWGLDAILGLVPVLGDLIGQAIATYIIWEARRLGASKLTLARMLANTLADTLIGAVPVAGDAFDVAFRANMKNLRLLQRHLEKHGYCPAGAGPIIEGDWRRVA